MCIVHVPVQEKMWQGRGVQKSFLTATFITTLDLHGYIMLYLLYHAIIFSIYRFKGTLCTYNDLVVSDWTLNIMYLWPYIQRHQSTHFTCSSCWIYWHTCILTLTDRMHLSPHSHHQNFIVQYSYMYTITKVIASIFCSLNIINIIAYN